MHPRFSCLISGLLHALAVWMLASADDVLHVDFAVRAGQAMPAISQAAHAQPVLLDSRLPAESAMEVPSPVFPEIPPEPVELLAAADLDSQPLPRDPPSSRFRRTEHARTTDETAPAVEPTDAMLQELAVVPAPTRPLEISAISEPLPDRTPILPRAETPSRQPLEVTEAELLQERAPESVTPRNSRARLPRSTAMPAIAELPPRLMAEATPHSTSSPSRLPTASPTNPEPEVQRLTTAAPPQTVAEFTEPAESRQEAMAANDAQGAKVDHLPRPLPENREPVYPEDLRRRQIGGRVLLSVLIAADGSVSEVFVAQSSGQPALDSAAVTAIRAWRFVPAQRGPQAVAYRVQLPVNFSIRR